jgi:hypothetical protein
MNTMRSSFFFLHKHKYYLKKIKPKEAKQTWSIDSIFVTTKKKKPNENRKYLLINQAYMNGLETILCNQLMSWLITDRCKQWINIFVELHGDANTTCSNFKNFHNPLYMLFILAIQNFEKILIDYSKFAKITSFHILVILGGCEASLV